MKREREGAKRLLGEGETTRGEGEIREKWVSGRGSKRECEGSGGMR